MEINTSFAGTRLKDYRKNIHWRDTTNYAAALNDDNVFYVDDELSGRLSAHPMYCAAVTWPVVERIWEYITADNFPMEILATQVHYSEHIQFFRLVVPGDRLLVRGKITAILPHRAGTRVVIRFDVTDDNGLPVFTEHIGSIMRGVHCIGKGKGEETLPRISEIKNIRNTQPAQGNANGNNPVWESKIAVSRLHSFLYDGCSNIVFPIHTSKKFARQVGLPDIILQGTATLGFAIRELVNREADGDPTQINSLYARFSGMVIPGTDIRVILTEKILSEKQQRLHFCVKNDQGDIVIKDGVAGFLKA